LSNSSFPSQKGPEQLTDKLVNRPNPFIWAQLKSFIRGRRIGGAVRWKLANFEITAVIGATAPPTREPGGTDSTSFSWIGLNGYGFMQDPLEYGSRTHHSNMDLYDRVQVGDVMQGAALEAWFVYNTATRPEMLPRNPVPTPTAK
jgi:hypothetical protein